VIVLPPVAILAGGRGTRLGELVRDTPKPLLEVAGEPFLLHQLRLLRAHGAQRVVLCVGYLAERFEEMLATVDVSLDVVCSRDKEPGTASALRHALPLLGEEFLVLYGDAYLRIDYAAVAAARRTSGLPALMTVLPWQGGNAEVRADRVVRYDKAGGAGLDWIDYGLQALTGEALAASADAELTALQSTLAADGALAAFEASERFYEIGTPDALREVDAFLRSAHPTSS
jgi:N-acetyl-alpha-D-muramate 1-phosphate uridylyltransferase